MYPLKKTTVIITERRKTVFVDIASQSNVLPIKKPSNNDAKIVKTVYMKTTQTIKPRDKENVPIITVDAPANPPMKEIKEKIKARLKSTDSEKNDFYDKLLMELSISSAFDNQKFEKEKSPLLRNFVTEKSHNYDKKNCADIDGSSRYTKYFFYYLTKKEELEMIPNYIPRQPEVTESKRSSLINWMVEIQKFFYLYNETLYLAVKLVDLFLSKTIVEEKHLKLIGITAIFIASKYEEPFPPKIIELDYVCGGIYSKREILKTEYLMLIHFEFNIGFSISFTFLRRYARWASVNELTFKLAKYVLEMSLTNYEIVRIRESEQAAASMYIALRMSKAGGWTQLLEYYTGFKLNDIILTVYLINGELQLQRKNNIEFKSIREKYQHESRFKLLDNSEL